MYPDYMGPLIVEKKLYRNNDGFLRLLLPAAWGVRHGDAVELKFRCPDGTTHMDVMTVKSHSRPSYGVPMAWNLDAETPYTVEARILGRRDKEWEEADQE